MGLLGTRAAPRPRARYSDARSQKCTRVSPITGLNEEAPARRSKSADPDGADEHERCCAARWFGTAETPTSPPAHFVFAPRLARRTNPPNGVGMTCTYGSGSDSRTAVRCRGGNTVVQGAT